jgi:hypothetical protein
MKSKQQIKNQNTNCCRQTHPPPVSESMQPASIAGRKKSASSARIAGWKKSASPASFLSPKNSFLSPNPALSAEKKKPGKNPLFFLPNTRFFFLCSSSKKKKKKKGPAKKQEKTKQKKKKINKTRKNKTQTPNPF